MQLNVRGHSAVNQKARWLPQFLSRIFDLGVFVAIQAVLNAWMILSPQQIFWTWAMTLPLYFGIYFLVQPLLHATLGQRLWGLRQLGYRKPVLQQRYLAPLKTALASFLTVLSLGASVQQYIRILSANPYLQIASSQKLPPAAPSPSWGRWNVIPFFYSVGAWPSEFLGRPIFYSLPYEKGPPEKFVGHIIAQWDDPHTRIIMEGPKTPLHPPSLGELKSCFSSWQLRCLKLREELLSRHIHEMNPASLALSWFEIHNPNLTDGERPRGIRLRSQGSTLSQDRFVFMTSRGTQQTFILEHPNTPQGEMAQKIFEEVIRSQRISLELSPSRLWINRELAAVKFNQTLSLADYSQVQALLLSKISVEPGTLETYFHLGGTASLMARQALKAHDSELNAITQPLVHSSLLYAQDIAPQDPKTGELAHLWMGLKKR